MTGSCEYCSTSFALKLIHNGFNDTSYAYCGNCGMTALLNAYSKCWPSSVKWNYAEIAPEMERYLRPCECGGNFSRGNSPRCPHCKQILSAESAASYIEAQSAGSVKGWRWQRHWSGLYCVVIEGRRVEDNFKGA